MNSVVLFLALSIRPVLDRFVWDLLFHASNGFRPWRAMNSVVESLRLILDTPGIALPAWLREALVGEMAGHVLR